MLWRVNERRNVPLAKLAALKGVDVEFFSLQKGKLAEAELAELVSQNWDGPAIIDFTNELDDFADTAALMDNLDLIVTVDTSTAHLAGALGKPVWILVRFESDWRYLLEALLIAYGTRPQKSVGRRAQTIGTMWFGASGRIC